MLSQASPLPAESELADQQGPQVTTVHIQAGEILDVLEARSLAAWGWQGAALLPPWLSGTAFPCLSQLLVAPGVLSLVAGCPSLPVQTFSWDGRLC